MKNHQKKKILKLCSLSGKHFKYKEAEPDNEVCEARIGQIWYKANIHSTYQHPLNTKSETQNEYHVKKNKLQFSQGVS